MCKGRNCVYSLSTINIIKSDNQCEFKCFYFPVHTRFAAIINKVKGESLKEVGTVVRAECFLLAQKLILEKLTHTGASRKI
jgi:hypothetical protein